ncbi:hypothetical protein [Caproiciproducens sp. LBM24188]
MDLFIKILILIGGIFLFDKLLDKFATRDKLIRRIEALGKQFSLFQADANETIEKYKNAYDSLARVHKDYQENAESLLSQSGQMTEQVVLYAHKMIEDNDRLYKRLDLIERFLTSENPSQEDHENLIQAIKEDIKLKEEFEMDRKEFLSSLHDQPALEESPEIEMRDD